jgi:cytoskeletal protein CcmA (bactofilin family)
MRARRTFGARAVLVVVLAGAAVAAGAGPAAAAVGDIDRNDQVVLNGKLVVPDGETIGSGVIINGPARIDGTVRETLFVLNGHVDIGGTVVEDVVVVNGDVLVRSGAHVGGDIVSRSRPTIEEGARVDGNLERVGTRFDWEDFGFAGRFVWWVGYTASTLFLGLLLLLLFPPLDNAIVAAWRERVGGAIGAGAAVFFLLPIVAVLMLVTIVGIPLGVFMLFALGLLYSVGYVAGAQALGRQLVKPPTSRFLAFLAGWGILRVVALVPVLGGFAWLVASLVGLGLLTVALRTGRTQTETTETPPPPPPPSTTAATTTT